MKKLPQQLPLLEMTASLFPKNVLKDTYLICCQHLLPSLQYFLRSAQSLGLSTQNISVIGKCYSASRLAYNLLLNDNISVSNDTFSYNSHVSFDEQFTHYIDTFMENSLQKIDLTQGKKIIILDDGGELLRSASHYLPQYDNLLGIEQTSSGYNKLANKKFTFPIINVARSFAKLNFESPHIAISILKQLSRITPIADKEILIIGSGAIGSMLFRQLNTSLRVDIYDQNHHSNKNIVNVVDLKKYDIIIGATGTTVLDNSRYTLLKENVILISASSSDREFSAVHLRTNIYQQPNCHANIYTNKIHLINSGFPLNFYGSDYDNVPLEKIQLTISLLFAGICQSVNSEKGFIDLDTDIQNFIIKKSMVSGLAMVYV